MELCVSDFRLMQPRPCATVATLRPSCELLPSRTERACAEKVEVVEVAVLEADRKK